MKWVLNQMPKSEDRSLAVMALENVERARCFHESFPQYQVTPLESLGKMADYLGLGGIYVKDESYRFGLNAFKVLGGSFAMARYIAEEMGKDISAMNFDDLTSEAFLLDFGRATFFTATDGNHGRGVAWAAKRLGQRAVVYMPKGSSRLRFDHIEREGAKVSIEEGNYDACVRLAAEEAAKTEHGVLLQDTAWEGYEKIPSWIMQGYGTMVWEAQEQLRDRGICRPTHVFVQAGVGSMAASVVGYFVHRFPVNPPRFIVMEAESAACLYQGAKVGTGERRICTGDLSTVMAGLSCGEPSTIGWDILRNHADAFVACPDALSARGMRMLAAPLPLDPVVKSGESGAVGMGVLSVIMQREEYRPLREALNLGRDSQVLLFSTEGDTDPESYRRIVWDGECPSLPGDC